MRIYREPISFEWDSGNVDKNYRKHSVSNQEAEQVFVNEPKFFFEDAKHSDKEKRFGLYGKTDKERLLSIVFTKRDSRIRVITARDMSRKERKVYEKNKKNSKI